MLAVVHRDVSPHNIIMSYEGAVKLLDFGVAMSSVTEQAESMIAGKWNYMSPEHTTNQPDHRSDLFSLGVILYLLCSGRMPFSGSDPIKIVEKIRAGRFESLAGDPGVPEPLARLIDRMLAPKPDERPQTGQEVANALTEIGRSQRMETAQADIAAFLARLFADELSPSSGVEAGDLDMTTVRVAASPPQSQGQSQGQSQEPSVTPTPNRVTPTSMIGVDASVSIVPRTIDPIGATQPAIVQPEPRTGSASQPPGTKSASQLLVRPKSTSKPPATVTPAQNRIFYLLLVVIALGGGALAFLALR
jgi:serine/threonine-protein kinase